MRSCSRAVVVACCCAVFMLMLVCTFTHAHKHSHTHTNSAVRTRLESRILSQRRSIGDSPGATNTGPIQATMSAQPPPAFPQAPTSPPLVNIPNPNNSPPPIPAGAEFPNEAPPPPPSSVPPPLSPSGRWLHSMTLIDGKMYVYGGVGSYSTALFNDMWLYNFAENTWNQMQASYLPPFPVDPNPNTAQDDAKGQLDAFRPEDAPASPAMREDPDTSTIPAPMPGADDPTDPELKTPDTKNMKVVSYEAVPAQSPMKGPGYSFVEVESSTISSHGVMEQQEDSATPQNTNFIELSSSEFLKLSTEQRMRHHRASVAHSVALRARNDPGTVANPDPAVAASQAGLGEAPGGGQAPRFWKNSDLAPGLFNPFISADLWAFDLDTKLWKNVKAKSNDVPAPRWLHSACTIEGSLVIFGGVSYSDIILGDVWVFRPGTAQWIRGNPVGTQILPREGHSAVVLKSSEMYVFGGISYGQLPFNDLWKYEATKNLWTLLKPTGPTPPPRWMHTAVRWETPQNTEKMIIFGGVTRQWIPLDDTWVYDVATNTWEHLKTTGFPPYPRFLHQASIMHHKLFILAGTANNMPLDDMMTLDLLAGNIWEETNLFSEYPLAREGFGSAVVEPPEPTFQPAPPPEYTPPAPHREGEEEDLTPLIKDIISPRPLNRYRKEYKFNRYWIIFGGAGPKPKSS
jgi:N-acetylneuraminic acid mutarotase